MSIAFVVTSTLESVNAKPQASVPRSYQLLLRWLDQPRPIARVVVLVLAMCSPALTSGLEMDDYLIEQAVRQNPWSAFEFLPRDPAARAAAIREARDAGVAPWWTDDLRQLAFMRPIASLSHAVDFRMWPNALWLMHLENIALFALVVWLVGRIYTALELPRAVLALATFFYAMSGTLGVTAGWISGRNTLLAAAFGASAIWLHIRAGTSLVRLRLQLMAAVMLALALLSAEFGAGAAGFLLAYALVFEDGPLVRRVVSCWPYAIVLVAWQALHIAGGYGAVGSGYYFGPLQEPWLFARGVVNGLPIYLATQLYAPIASIATLYPVALVVVTGLSLLILYLMRGMLLPLLRSERRARFLLLGAALSTLPLAATAPQDRLVLFVSLGTAAIVALIVTQRFDAANRTLGRTGANVLYRVHAHWLPAMFIPMLLAVGHGNAIGGAANAIASALPATGERGVVLLNAPTEMTYQTPIRARRGLPPLPSFDLLYAGSQSFEVRRPSENSLELETPRGWFRSLFERVTRNPDRQPLHVGDVVEIPRFRATVLSVDAGAPTRVRYEFPAPLEALPVEWLAFRGRQPERWSLPPVGGRESFGPLLLFP